MLSRHHIKPYLNSLTREFGRMTMPSRQANAADYRYGYQGSEKDNEVKGQGNSYTTHFRQLDPRIGRWFTIDPKATAFESPYASMGNNPILFNDPLGDIFKIGSKDKQAKSDVNSLTKKKNQKYINYADDGTVSLDFGDMKQKKTDRKLEKDAGLRLIGNLSTAVDEDGKDLNFFYGTEGETKIGLENPEKQINVNDYYTKVGKNPPMQYLLGNPIGINPKSQVLNASTTPYSDDGSKFGLVPQDDYDGKIYINSGNFYLRVDVANPPTESYRGGLLVKTTTYRTVNQIIDRSRIVFHELRENYLRTAKKYTYERAHKEAGGAANADVYK